MNKVVLNGIYRHFKGSKYKVILIAEDSEDLSKKVIYQDIDNNRIWVRDYEQFLSKVDKTKYPNIKQINRFELID